jgi:predicted Zn-dependent peptidase
MNRLGKNELMLGRHYTLDEMLDRIDAVTMGDIRDVTGRMLAAPFAVAMVGASDKPIASVRRDAFVSGQV